jgi:pimeloyl-ACP methyl ester carboxylesterase
MDGTGELIKDFASQLSAYRPVQIIAYPAERPLGYAPLVSIASSQLPEANVVLVAESFSGPVAIELAASVSRVAGLVLVSSFARRPVRPLLAAIASVSPIGHMPAIIISRALLGSAGTVELKQRVSRVLKGLKVDVVRARLKAVMEADKLERLRDVPCPVLSIHGRFDRLVGMRSVDEIRSVQPACQVLSLDGPHMLLETHPLECAVAINDFCKPLDKGD